MIEKLASYDNDIDFTKIWRYGAIASAVAVLIAVGSLVGRGLNLGIDFEGGTAWEVVAPDVSVSEARDALGEVGAASAKIQIVGGDTLRVQAEPDSDGDQEAVTRALADLAGSDRSEVAVSTVGPTWGDEISEAAQRALVFFFLIVAGYIAIRLEYKMAIGALVAVVHDIAISVGVYSLFQFEVTPATVIAFLTIMGYSLYDTIVVFDKVKENSGRPVAQRLTYSDLMSLSTNQVLMRSVNTTVTSLLPVLSMLIVGSLILGAVTLQEFAVALTIGLLCGAYSTLFIAAPLVARLKEREPYYRSLRSKLEGRSAVGATAVTRTPTTASSRAASSGDADAPQLSGRVIPPRPRKKGKKR